MDEHNPMMEAAEKCIEALDAVDRAGDSIPSIGHRIELDEDDQAEEAGRIVRRFPLYVQYIFARAIHDPHGDVYPYVPPDDPFDLDDDALAGRAEMFADKLPPVLSTTTASDERKRGYFRILSVALRHFQDDPAAVRAAILLVSMIAKTGKADR